MVKQMEIEQSFVNLNNSPLSFIDFCSGIGGGRLGLERNGFSCLGYSEIDKNAIHTYKSLYGDEQFFGDLTQIDIENLPIFDLLISGFPCQSFSIIGQRYGLDDIDKGQIIFYLADIMSKKEINYFILENVKGLINHDKGQTLEIVLNLLDNIGYNVTYKLLNSMDFGVPQMRERVYFVGIKKDLSIQNNFVFPDKYDHKINLSEFLCDERSEFIFDENNKNYQTFLKYLNNKYNKDKYSIKEFLKEEYLVLDTRQSDLRLYRNKVPTIRRGRQGILYVKNGILRKLSGFEALLLQGFDKHYAKNAIKNQSNSHLLAQAGNAMTVNVIDSIAKQLLKQIK